MTFSACPAAIIGRTAAPRQPLLYSGTCPRSDEDLPLRRRFELSGCIAWRLARSAACLLLPALLLGACNATSSREILVTLLADGRERSLLLPEPLPVASFLRNAGLEVGPLDRVAPAPDAILRDGMRVTLVRVREHERCERVEVPYRVRSLSGESPGTAASQRVQPGIPGEEQRCFLVRTEDGRQGDIQEIRRVLIRDPVDELWQAAPDTVDPPLPFAGALVWLQDGDAWLARGAGARPRQLTNTADLDGAVLALSPNGRRLLFTRAPASPDRAAPGNQLWLLPDISSPTAALPLLPAELLTLSWSPRGNSEFAYVARAAPATLALMRIDPDSGATLHFREWPTHAAAPAAPQSPPTSFAWAPDGSALAWSRPNALGLIDLDSGAQRILRHSGASPPLPPSACPPPPPSWSPDSRLIASLLPPDGAGPAPQFALFVTDRAAPSSTFASSTLSAPAPRRASRLSPWTPPSPSSAPATPSIHIRTT